MSEFILYSYFRSSAAFRVRIALNLKKITYEYRAVHLLKQEQHAAEYRKLNPIQQVPTLVHQGHPIGQSMAILDYLDSVCPEPPLFPKEAYRRAQVIQACELINSGVHPLHNSATLQKLASDFGADDNAKNAWTSFYLRKGLEALETFLEPVSGAFCFGDAVSAADCFLIPILVTADRFNVSLSDFTTLKKIRATCDQLDDFKKAGIKAQPDTPAELRET